MNGFREFLRCSVLIGCGLVLAGCVSGASSQAAFLLNQDYLRMTDTDLIAHERAVSDELVLASQRSGSSDVNIGVGFGSWGRSSGYGIRADKWLGGSGDNSTVQALKFHRDEVRDELRRRQLLPE